MDLTYDKKTRYKVGPLLKIQRLNHFPKIVRIIDLACLLLFVKSDLLRAQQQYGSGWPNGPELRLRFAVPRLNQEIWGSF